jgi:hypothetical protein
MACQRIFVVPKSRLVHARPLRDGESLTYEFFYEPGRAMVHPSLGRLAFVLEPAGLRLHGLTDGPGRQWSGLDSANAAHEPNFRRGSGHLPLRSGRWNRVTLQLRDGAIALDLNGQRIGQWKLEPDNDRHFDLYHDPDRTSVGVRGVVLSGPWPEKGGSDLLTSLKAMRATRAFVNAPIRKPTRTLPWWAS